MSIIAREPTQALYIFLDEGGNFDFSNKGTKYFTLTALTRVRPFSGYEELTELKYDILEEGLDLQRFHATEDKQHVRNRVFGIICNHLSDFRLDCIVAEKRKAQPHLQDFAHFYSIMLGYLLRYVLKNHDLIQYKQIVIISDSLPDKKKKNHTIKTIKSTLNRFVPWGFKYTLLHHDSKSNFYLQVVDYCNWAIEKKWKDGDLRSYDLIKGAIRSEFDIFRTGTESYY